MKPPVRLSATPSDQPRPRRRSSTADSIVSSSTPNTRSPRIARSSFSSASTKARAAASESPLAVMRTTRPSMPRARNAMVGLPVASSASSRCATISASADSEVPHVFNERDTIVDAAPLRARRSGSTCAVIISCISYGTPGTAYTILPSPTGHTSPGAVPSGFGIAAPPSGMSACRRLFSGMSRRRARNIVAICSASSMRRTSGTPISSAMASRVRSSWVGPSPPHTMTASARDNRSRSAATMRAWLSPMTRCS